MNRGLLILVLAAAVASARAETPSNEPVDVAVKKGVSFLLDHQKADGSISDGRYQNAMTALSLMAICATGHSPAEKSREGEAVRRAIEYVLQKDRQDDGYFGSKDNSRMYGHGIVSLMLAEVIGMGADADQDLRIRQRLDRAFEITLWSQEKKSPDNKSEYGGWRYSPKDGDSDLSVTIWQVMALRAAKNAGLAVPKTAIDKAVAYIKHCYKSKRSDDGKPENLKSACAYRPGDEPHFATATAGLRALQVCGEYEAAETKGSADWIREHMPKYNERFFYYGLYYYAQGMYQQGGEDALAARKFVESILFEKQKPDGSWQSEDGQERDAGLTYSTSMALLSLSVKYHYLPLYER